jgi:hypothetical protein
MLFNHHSKTPNPRESLQEMKVIFLIHFGGNSLLLTVPKAAEELSISRSSMYRLISAGFILHYLDAISDDPETDWKTTENGRKLYRAGGVVIFILMVLVVSGVDIAGWLVG